MSWIYAITMSGAGLLLLDDMCLGNIHPVRGGLILGVLVYSVAYIRHEKERKCKR